MKQDAVEQFLQAFQAAFHAGQLNKCTLSKPTPGAVVDLKNVYVRPVLLKKGMQLAFNYHYKTRDEVKNYALEAGITLLREMLGQTFLNADLLTTEHDFSLQISSKGEAVFFQKKALSNGYTCAGTQPRKTALAPTHRPLASHARHHQCPGRSTRQCTG
jgi:hypothetical protein